MNIETFLKGINKKSKDYNDSNELFRVPKGDKTDDIPHIKILFQILIIYTKRTFYIYLLHNSDINML